MDRLTWTDGVFLAFERPVIQVLGVRIYDGETKVSPH
jgi:hypothetical protein